jgi:DNA-binding transcriptional LysR family regulator
MANDLDLRRLRFFVQVVEHGGFSAAAKALFSTQSTVSKAVKQLEDDLGVRLLNRIGSRIEPTAEGEYILERARQLLSEANDLQGDLDAIRGIKRGRLRIGFPRMGVSSLFVAPYVKFRLKHANVEVELTPFAYQDLMEALRAGQLDFGVVIDPVPPDMSYRHIASSCMMAVVPASHPLAGRASVSLADLAPHGLIVCDATAPVHAELFRAFQAYDGAPRIAARTDQLDFMFELAAAGVGIGFAPDIIARARRHPQTQAIAIEGDGIRWSISYAWRTAASLSHAARAWLALPTGISSLEQPVTQAAAAA